MFESRGLRYTSLHHSENLLTCNFLSHNKQLRYFFRVECAPKTNKSNAIKFDDLNSARIFKPLFCARFMIIIKFIGIPRILFDIFAHAEKNHTHTHTRIKVGVYHGFFGKKNQTNKVETHEKISIH